MRITDGVTRDVWLIGRWAIKVPTLRYSWRLFLRGLLSNMNEREMWAWSGLPDWAGPSRDVLGRVVWSSWGGWVLVMERVRVLRDDERSRMPDCDIADMKPDNCGETPDGRVVVIDYGEGWGRVEAEHERRGDYGD